AKALGIGAALLRRVRDVASMSCYDAVVVHRAACLVGPAIIERALPSTSRPMLYDFDDAIHLLHTSGANSLTAWLKWPSKTATLCRLSAAVVAGNSYLAAFAKQHNARVAVIPSSVDIAQYRPRQHANGKARVVVGWVGSATSQSYLEWFAPTLREIRESCDI